VQALLEQRYKQERVNKSRLVNDLLEQALGAERDGRRAAALLDELLEEIEGSGDRDSVKSKLDKSSRCPSRCHHAPSKKCRNDFSNWAKPG
jgi:hypothetical protein